MLSLEKPLVLCVLFIGSLSICSFTGYKYTHGEPKSNPVINRKLAQSALPIVTFSKATVPGIAANIENAQKLGKPTILTRQTAKEDINSNRYQACTKVFKATPADIAAGRTSCDEYPFASTKEGGQGAVTAAVKPTENSSQGGTLRGFYVSKGIKDGDQFKVEVGP